MNEPKEDSIKLWRKIGLNREALQESIDLVQAPSVSHKLDKSGKVSVLSKSEANFQSDGNNPNSFINKLKPEIVHSDPNLPKTDEFLKAIDMLDVSIRQIVESEHMIIQQQESHLQKMVQPSQSEQVQNEDKIDSYYNYDLSQQPYSITPLVYSKTSRRGDQIKFKKDAARLIIIKMKLSELKEILVGYHNDLLQFLDKIKEQHSHFNDQLCCKYFQITRQHSMRLQQSVFNQKQEYEQLKYEYQILKSKQQTMRIPVRSQFFIKNRLESSVVCHDINMQTQPQAPKVSELIYEEQYFQTLATQNEELKGRIRNYEQDNKKLMKQANQFKRKIGQIQAKTFEVRQSNDKLYEYIFDLQQKIAFQQEEIPAITLRIKEQSETTTKRQLEETAKRYSQEIDRITFELEHLSQENYQLKQMLQQTPTQNTQQIDKQTLQLKLIINKYEEQTNTNTKIIEEKDKEIFAKTEEIKQIRIHMQTLTKEKEMLQKQREKINKQKQKAERQREEAVKEICNKQKNDRTSQSRIREIEVREKGDKKIIQTLQIQKIVLQKEVIQLKATLQFMNKNCQSPSSIISPQYSQNRSYTPYQLDSQPLPNYQSQSHVQQTQLLLKQQQLLQMQTYLQSEARKLQNRERQISYQTTMRRAQEVKYRQPAPIQPRSYQFIPGDDYGMKGMAINPNKAFQSPVSHNITQRKNNFCSSEAQAIIEKVKMRQKMRDVSCHCDQPRNCKCENVSKGSRGSQDSNSKDYWKGVQYRPQNYSPANKVEYYFKKQDKSVKMKLIEDKVRRLKSQLKTSLSAMKD